MVGDLATLFTITLTLTVTGSVTVTSAVTLTWSVPVTASVTSSATVDASACCHYHSSGAVICRRCLNQHQLAATVLPIHTTRLMVTASRLTQLDLCTLPVTLALFKCSECQLAALVCSGGAGDLSRSGVVSAGDLLVESVLPDLVLSRLHHLLLSHNQLTHIDDQLLAKLASLHTLDLSHNRLATLDVTPLAALRRLNLNHNRLATIAAHSLANTPHLNELLLSHNRLVRVDALWQLASTNLTLIDLSHNRLRHLRAETHSDTWRHLNVKHLKLDGNPLPAEPIRTLQSLTQINTLTLNRIQLTNRLTAATFRRIHVRVIVMRRLSVLSAIERRAFHSMLQLERLEITDCRRLVYLETGWLHNVPQLVSVILSRNALVTLHPHAVTTRPPDVTASLSSDHKTAYGVGTIDLSHNPLQCDCTLNWLLTQSLSGQIRLLASDTCLMTTDGSSQRPKQLTADVCTPVIVPLTPHRVTVELGQQLQLLCPSQGQPEPELTFQLPSGRQLTWRQCVDTVCVDRHHHWMATVEYSGVSDGGRYVCRAENALGVSQRDIHVTVRQPHVRLIPVSVAATFVTLRWQINGTTGPHFYLNRQAMRQTTGARSLTSDTVNNRGDLVPSDGSGSYHAVHLPVHSRSFTFSHLTAATWYRFEITVQPAVNISWVVASVVARTHEKNYQRQRGRSLNYPVVVAVAAALLVLAALCCQLCLCRLYRWCGSCYSRGGVQRHLARAGLLPSSVSRQADLAFLSVAAGVRETTAVGTAVQLEQKSTDDEEPDEKLLKRSARKPSVRSLGRRPKRKFNRSRSVISLFHTS